MNRLLCLCVGILFSISAVFAVEWVIESAAFEFPASGVKNHMVGVKSLNFTTALMPGNKQIMLRFTLPAKTANAVINIYSINGVRVSTFKLNDKSKNVVWNITKKAAGTYAAELKTETVQKTIRFVIAH